MKIQNSHERQYSRTLNPVKDQTQSTFNYNHSLEAKYISNISDSYQRAEEETKKAEQMLAQWKQRYKRDDQRHQKEYYERDRHDQRQNQSYQVTRNDDSNDHSNQSLEESDDEDSSNEQANPRTTSFSRISSKQTIDAHVERRIHSLRRDLGINHDYQQNMRSRVTPQFKNQHIQSTITQKSNHDEIIHRHLNPQLLDQMSSNNTQESHFKSRDRRDTSHQNLIQLQNVPITTSLSTGPNFNDQPYSTEQTKNESYHSQSDVIADSHNVSHLLQDNINTINRQRNDGFERIIKPPVINVKEESELIALDKHYKQLLKTEREEHQRQLVRVQQQAKRDAEQKLRKELNDARTKTEVIEKLELNLVKCKAQNEKLTLDNEKLKRKKKKLEAKQHQQNRDMTILQKKLDDLWERQKMEKENAQLVTKYEVEKENRRIITDLTNKVMELEARLREKDRDLDTTRGQLEHIRREIINESQQQIQLNKSVDKVQEMESKVIQEENSKLQEQVMNLELEIYKMRNQDIHLSEKYESLKRKFAIAIKEKEQIEQGKLQETAKFKESNQDCQRCAKWKNKAQDLTDKYFLILKNMRVDLDHMRKTSQSMISHAQREIHTEVISTLKGYLEKSKSQSLKKSLDQQSMTTITSKTADTIGTRKGSVVVMSKTHGQLIGGSSISTDNQANRSQIITTERIQRDHKTIDNSQIRSQSASLRTRELHKNQGLTQTLPRRSKVNKKKAERKRSKSAQDHQKDVQQQMRKRNEVVPIYDGLTQIETPTTQYQSTTPNLVEFTAKPLYATQELDQRKLAPMPFVQQSLNGTIGINPSDGSLENAQFDEDGDLVANGPSKRLRIQNKMGESVQSNPLTQQSPRYNDHNDEDKQDISHTNTQQVQEETISQNDRVVTILVENQSEESKSKKKRSGVSKQPRQTNLAIDTANLPKNGSLGVNNEENSAHDISGSASSRAPRSGMLRRRRDQFGTRISKGSKRHKVSFADQIQKNKLTEVFLVESYKKFNRSQFVNEEEESYCHCLIF